MASFRINGKIFSIMRVKERLVMVGLSLIDQSVFFVFAGSLEKDPALRIKLKGSRHMFFTTVFNRHNAGSFSRDPAATLNTFLRIPQLFGLIQERRKQMRVETILTNGQVLVTNGLLSRNNSRTPSRIYFGIPRDLLLTWYITLEPHNRCIFSVWGAGITPA